MSDTKTILLRRKGEKDRPIHDTKSILCDFDDDVYVCAIWNIVATIVGNHEILAMLWRKRDDDFWQFRFRARTNMGTADPFDGADPKTAYVLSYDLVDEAAALKRASEFCNQLANQIRAEICDRHDLRCWGPDAIKEFVKLPFAHVQQLDVDPTPTARGGRA